MENVLDKLTEEQAQIALEIARKAKEMGVDPRLAIALAYRESGLNPQAKGGKGEVGLMQVMPATAKGLGFTPEELADPSKNIEIGLTYLKRGLEKFGGDPVLAAAGYNAGLDHPYFSDPDNKSLPASTKEYLKGINGLGGFTSSPAKQEDAPQQVEAPASESDFQANKARIAADLIGAGAGAGIAKGLDITKNVGDTAAAIRQLPGVLAGQAPAGPTVAPAGSAAPGMARPVAGGPAGPVGGPSSSGAKWLQNWGGIAKEGFSGGVPDAAAQYNKMKPQGQIMQGLAKKGLITPQPVQPGVFTGGQLSISGRPPAPPPPPAPPGPLSQAAGAVKQGAGAVLRSPVAMGALGGLSMAESGQEAEKRFSEGDIPGAAIAGAGVLGGGMQMLPSRPTKAVGAMISAASPLTLYLYDKLRGQGAQEPQGPTERELMEMSKPAFGIYPKPMRQPPLRPRTFEQGENMPPVEFLR